MARLSRVVVPELPLHVIQRGTNRCEIFLDERDYQFFLNCMQESCEEHGCDVHAYVLMTNHVHFLLTPRSESGPSALMHAVGSRYALYFNHRYDRIGTLWQGRYRGAIVDSDEYFFVCARYIELNPVRAGMVRAPADYRWSSYVRNALGRPDPLVRPHDLVDSLGNSLEERCAAYAAMFDAQIDDMTLGAIRESTNKGWALGGTGFRKRIETTTGKRVAPRRGVAGRVDM